MTVRALTPSIVFGLLLLGARGAAAEVHVGQTSTPDAQVGAGSSTPSVAAERTQGRTPTSDPAGPCTCAGAPASPADQQPAPAGAATGDAEAAAGSAASLGACAAGSTAACPPAVVPASALVPAAPGPAAAPAPEEDDSLLHRLEPKGRFLGGVESDEVDDYGRRYGIRQARLGLAYREGPIRAEVEADLAETQVLNDAWLEYRGEAARGRLGRFKAPFSGFLLSSSWERPVLRRAGLPRAVRDLGFGGRDVGAQATYRAKPLGRLEVEAGLFEGAAIGAAAAAEDGYARVTAAPWKPLRLGASVGRRAVFDGGAGDALGVDARLLLGGLTARLEGLRAENATTGASIAGAIGHVAYRFPVSGRTWLEPGVEAELASADAGDPRTTSAATLGVGLGERFLVRGGLEHGPVDPTGPASTALLLLAGVQL